MSQSATQAEEARQHAESRFTEMVENVRDHSIFLTDPQGVLTSWNAAAERIIGYTTEEVVGRHFSIIFTPEDLQAGVNYNWPEKMAVPTTSAGTWPKTLPSPNCLRQYAGREGAAEYSAPS